MNLKNHSDEQDNSKIARLDELIGALREDALSEAEAAELRDLLDNHPAAMRRLAEQMTLSAALSETLGKAGYEDARSQASLEANRQTPGTSHTSNTTRLWLSHSLVAGVAAAVTLIVSMTASFMTDGSEKAADELIKPVAKRLDQEVKTMAMIKRSVGAVWSAETTFSSDEQLAPGHYNLQAGMAQVTFYGGTTVTLNGPANLEIINGDQAALHSGKMTVHVPFQSREFSLAAGDMRMRGLNNTFGVKVSEEAREVPGDIPGEVFGEVHVLSGTLLVRQHGVRKSIDVLDAGKAVKLDASGLNAADYDAADFLIDEAAIEAQILYRKQTQLDKWRAMSERLDQSPDKILYFNFEDERKWRISGDSGQNAADGALVGGEWTQGRWPGKKALKYRRIGDRVRVKVDGAFETFSMLISVRLDGDYVKGGPTSLFKVDGDAPGRFHWQLLDKGRLQFHIMGQNGFHARTPIHDPNQFGVWLHIVSVYDLPNRRASLYSNGQLVQSFELKHDIPIVIGAGELGNWNWESVSKKIQRVEGERNPRTLHGVIDEFCMLRKTLSAEEVLEIYEAGKAYP